MSSNIGKTYVTRCDFELVIVELKRGSGNMYTKKGCRVAIKDLDRRIQGQHVCLHPSCINSRLNVKMFKDHALPPYHHITINTFNWLHCTALIKYAGSSLTKTRIHNCTQQGRFSSEYQRVNSVYQSEINICAHISKKKQPWKGSVAAKCKKVKVSRH